MSLLLLFGGAGGASTGPGGIGSPIGLLLALTHSDGTVTPPVVTGLPKGGHGRRQTSLSRSQVEDYWTRYDRLIERNARLKQEERTKVEESAEAVARTLEAVEETEAPEAFGPQFDAMMAAVERATKALSAQKVIAEAKKAAEAAKAVLLAIEDENAAILLLLA